MFTKNLTLALVLGAALVSSARDADAQSFYVSPSQRELLIFITLAPSQPGVAQTFYNSVEFAAESLAVSQLGYRYGRVNVVKGGSATKQGFKNWVNYLTGKSSLKALDVVFVTHGLGGSVYFNNGGWTTSQLQSEMTSSISSSRRAKLRMMFSTACYGSSHRSAWRNIGFKAVSGARRIYADSALSYSPFLTTFAGYNRFRDAVSAANNADPARIQDNIAKGVLFAAGYSNWYDVDSYRYRSGWTSSVKVHRQIPGLQ